MEKSGRSQNRRNHLEKALRKRRGEKEQRRKGVEDRNKTLCFYYYF
jgi:hypothetical protein